MEKTLMKSGKPAFSGVIDIGSGFMQLKIACKDEKKQIHILESVTKSLAIGRETFSEGRISPEMMRELSKNLLGFRQLLREYKVRKVRVVATGAIREAENREYVMDQIRANTGYSIEIMTGSEERLLTQKAIVSALPGYEKMMKEGLLTVNIGSSSVQIAAYGSEGLKYSQNIPLGALRIQQTIGQLERKMVGYTKVLEEYIDYHIQEVMNPQTGKFRHLVITGEEVNSLYRICGAEQEAEIRAMDQQALKQLYDRLLFMNAKQIANELGLSFERSEMLLPTMIVMQAFERAVNAKKILCPPVGLSDGILYEMNQEKVDTASEAEILRYTRFVAKQYVNSEKHVEEVVKNALLIFDHLGRRQNLNRRHRMLLEMGAILHDIGKGVNLMHHPECGAALLSHMDLMGISEEEQNQLVVLVRYHESGEPKADDEAYRALNKKSRMAVSKLLAVLQLANAMDCSHKQKLVEVMAKQEGDELTLRAFAKENAMLEEWVFQQSSGLFREVFSLEPRLKIRTNQMAK